MENKTTPAPKSEYIKVIKKTDKRTYSGNILWEVQCCCGRKMLWSRRQILDYYCCGCKSVEIRFSKVWKGCGEISGELFSGFRKNARDRSLEFGITVRDIWEKFIEQGRKCALSDVDLHFGTESENRTASLDRIDSKKDYEEGNLVLCCLRCNHIKGDFFTQSEMVEIGKKYISRKWNNAIQH